jgi:hypothetical protein
MRTMRSSSHNAARQSASTAIIDVNWPPTVSFVTRATNADRTLNQGRPHNVVVSSMTSVLVFNRPGRNRLVITLMRTLCNHYGVFSASGTHNH